MTTEILNKELHNNSFKNFKYFKLDQIKHVLQRSSMYVGNKDFELRKKEIIAKFVEVETPKENVKENNDKNVEKDVKEALENKETGNNVEKDKDTKVDVEKITESKDNDKGDSEEKITTKLACLRKDIIISAALERIFLEALSNAGDNVERSRKNNIDVGIIKVDINGNLITVYNEGLHIPIGVDNKEGIPNPELIFGQLLTGSNFDDTKERIYAGTYGLGIKLCNIFSKKFIVEIGDPDAGKKYTPVFSNNMLKKEKPILEDYEGKGYTKITYEADFSRFEGEKELGIEKITTYSDDMKALFFRHCVDIAFTCKVPVYFCGIKVEFKNIVDYASLFIDIDDRNYIHWKDKQNEICIVDTPDKGEIVSFVNGMFTKQGGVHVEEWMDMISDVVKFELKKEDKKITKRHVRPHFTVILSNKLVNPVFDGQTKEKLKKPKPKISMSLTKMKEILKWNAISRISALFDAIQQTKANKIVKRRGFIDIPKADDAPKAGSNRSKECMLFLTEGDSAATMISRGKEKMDNN